MQPERVKFNGIEYDVIGTIKLNNGQFLFLKNNDDVLGLDMSKVNSSFFGVANPKEATKVEFVLIDYILEAIKNKTKSGKYKNIEELKKDIIDLNKYISNHSELLNNIKQLDFKDEIVLKTMNSLLSYFDEVMKSAPINLEGITSFKIEGKDYIKYEDQNGKVAIMDDNDDNRNFVEQLKSKQVESEYFKQDEVKEKALNVINDMNEFHKASYDLNDAGEIKLSDSSSKVVNSFDEQSDRNPIDNEQSQNEQNDKVLTSQQQDNNVVITEVKNEDNGTSLDIQKNNASYPPYNEEVVTQYLMTNRSNNIDITTFIDKNLHDFSVEQIDYLLNNYSLTDEYINKLNNQKSKKNIVEEENQRQSEKPKAKVFTLNNKPKAAYVDTLLLSFIVGLVAGMYLIVLILFIMS